MTELTGAHRDALIEATVAEFASAGYEAASLNRIIRAAGISKSSFYHAVGSKAELLDAVVETLVGDVRTRWTPPAPSEFAGEAFWPRVEQVLGELGALTAGDRALGLLGRIFYLPANGGADARTALLETVRTWVADVLQVGVQSRAVRDDLPADALAAAAFGMLRGLDEWALGAGTPGPDPFSPLLSDAAPAQLREPAGARMTSRGEDAERLAAIAASAPAILLRGLLQRTEPRHPPR